MQGSCECGAVRYEVSGSLRPVVGCHCSQCRKTSGHYVAATQAEASDFTLIRDEGLRWYRSSLTAQRGFCNICGSSLFWQENETSHISIMAGTLDGATDLRMDRHIHAEAKGDYYDLPIGELVDQSTLKFG
ncbi:GFA family protein [uncultured Roseovarius sp.]|uniref:GFA family protein n=1 Tax=uncultured Roseovarius sp. TaxID=293344 RepID=UPI002638A64D|nr:GFA family protein [uncultured Roseovarius sp.]